MGRDDVVRADEHASFEVEGEDYDELCALADRLAESLLGKRAYVRRMEIRRVWAWADAAGERVPIGPCWRADVDLWWDRDGVRS